MGKTKNKYLFNIFLTLVIAITIGMSVGTAFGKYVFSQDVGTFDLVIKPPVDEVLVEADQEASTDADSVDSESFTDEEEVDAGDKDIDIS